MYKEKFCIIHIKESHITYFQKLAYNSYTYRKTGNTSFSSLHLKHGVRTQCNSFSTTFT